MTEQYQLQDQYSPDLTERCVWLFQLLLTCCNCRDSFAWFLQYVHFDSKMVDSTRALSRFFNRAHNFVNRKHNVYSIDHQQEVKIPKSLPREHLDVPKDIGYGTVRPTKRVVPFTQHWKLFGEIAKLIWIDAFFTLMYYWFEHYPDTSDVKNAKISRQYLQQFMASICKLFLPLDKLFPQYPLFHTLSKTLHQKNPVWNSSLYLLITLNGIEYTFKQHYPTLMDFVPLTERLLTVRESMKETLVKKKEWEIR